MSVQMKGGPTEYPSTSWAHAACDVLYAAFGVLLLADDEPQPEPRPEVDAAFALGLGFAIVGGALFGLRGLFWRRQRELNGRV